MLSGLYLKVCASCGMSDKLVETIKVVGNDEMLGNVVGIIVECVCKLWDVGKVGGDN